MYRSTLILLSVLLLAACGREGATRPSLPRVAAEIVTVEKPVLVKVVEARYVPISEQYTRTIQHTQLPLWQCPLERDQLRGKLDLANGHRKAVEAIEGTKVKSPP